MRPSNFILRFFSLLFALATCAALQAAQCNVLILCSYTPESNNISRTVDTFEDELNLHGVKTNIIVESLGIDNFADVTTWKERMISILAHYRVPSKRPDIMLLLGQEALATYLSLDISDIPEIPVLCGRCSRNYVEIPKDTQTWDLDSHDVIDVNVLYNIVGGCFYEYDIDKNIKLINSLYPDIKSITFLSDNSYGGISLWAHVKNSALRFPGHSFNWLDGRNLTIVSAVDTVAQLPDTTALVVLTWRYDKDSRIYLKSSISMMRQNNVNLPVFTISTSGLDDWSIGGYIPQYDELGPLLARMLIDFLTSGKTHLYFIPSHYIFDFGVLQSHNIPESELPDGSDVVNRPQSVLQIYFIQILSASIAFLAILISLIVAVINLRKVRCLTRNLYYKQVELIDAKNKAEANSLLKTSFLADMSHEIRTPLNAIIGFSQVVVKQGEALSPDEKAKIVEIIDRNSTLLTSLLNSILDITSIESGRAKFQIQDIDMVELCKDSIAECESANASSGLAFLFKTDMLAFVLRTDMKRVQQVIGHLIGNAVKFTKEGSVTLELAKLEDGAARISVYDTGRGIPADKVEEVFARFVKLDEYSSGTGLGLSLCRLIVERFGGKIWVDPSYLKGAKLVFTIPPADETAFLDS